jgi:hypothetical protein
MWGDMLMTEKEMSRGVSPLEKLFHPLLFSPAKSHLSLYLLKKAVASMETTALLR